MSNSKTTTSTTATTTKKKQYPYHRRHTRYEIRLGIKIKADEEYETETKNISLDGVCFEAPKTLNVGQSLNLNIDLRSKAFAGPINCECRIVWIENTESGHRYGGQFTSFEGAGFRKLKNYLKTEIKLQRSE
ncbi:MAG: PilZ domain-containing protein [Deltaproteobacteria bacterium]|nr:PilZ domain-containing protein [Deltaproteobacteria bacterium]MBW1872069.1 PilZ domain-containing protein [Deltaproteobacteria bacterium]